MGSSHRSEPSAESTCKDDDCGALLARDAAVLSVHATGKSSVTGDASDAVLAS